TFRPKVTFSRPIDMTTLTTANFYATDTTGTRLKATIVPSDDGTYAWLFLAKPMPGGSTITLTADGSTIQAADGSLLEAEAMGARAGMLIRWSPPVGGTFPPGTTLSGMVADPGPDLKPMTFEDVRVGPDGVLSTADDVYLHPIANAKVFILGHEDMAV